MQTDTPFDTYRARIARFTRERDLLAHRSTRLSRARLVVFLAALALLLWAEWGAGAPAFVAGGALLAVFLVLVVRHGGVRRALRHREALLQINEEGLRRRERAWDALPGAGLAGPGADHAYAHDLDLFGPASLIQLLGPPATAFGRATLRAWLLAPAPPDEIRARQAAVAELAPRNDLRDELLARGRLMDRSSPRDVERFLEWAEGEPWLRHRPALRWAARLIPVATVGLGIARLAGAVDRPFWLIPVLVGFTLTMANRRALDRTFTRALGRADTFRAYTPMLRLVAESEFDAPRLRELRAVLGTGDDAAPAAMRRLERLAELADLRWSGLFHFPVHALTLWDFHVLDALERWQTQAGPRARAWLEALGEVEALAALAALAHDHPGWAFPEIVTDGEPALEARGLGHPLLRDDVRVTNDVVVGPPGTFLLVTGSNMSGKSTLLRAIGVNAVLGQAGGPVCAAEMRLPPVAVWTAIRVQDSLAKGVSYFMAELQRLKQVVDAATTASADGGEGEDDARRGRRTTPTVLYLLDEILHGTNSAERQIAAQRIIAFLVAEGAIGAVSTHDLALADSPALTPVARLVHFRETIRREDGRLVMSFDYRLRPGIATSTNALALMELIGLSGALRNPA